MEFGICIDEGAPWNWIRPLTFSCIGIITAVGNILVIISIVLVKNLQKPKNYFLMSLAFADLLIGTILIPYFIYQDATCTIETLTNMGCHIMIPISVEIFCCTASMIGLTIVSLDRYIALSYPLFYKVHATARSSAIIIFITWVTSMTIAIPIFGMHDMYRALLGLAFFDLCVPIHWEWLHIILMILLFYAPFVVMLASYVRIYYILGTRHSRKRELSGNYPVDESPRKKSIQEMIRAIFQENKGWTMLGMMLCSFLICLSPFIVLTTWTFIAEIGGSRVYPSHLVYEIVRWLSCAHSGINPFLYTMFDLNFRISFKDLITCQWKTQKSRISVFVMSETKISNTLDGKCKIILE